MNDETELDLEMYRALLLHHQEELLGDSESDEEAVKTVEVDQGRVGRLSRIDALQTQALGIEVKRRRSLELKRIAAALQRIDAGEYGYCVTCGERISAGRLEVDPAAAQCIRCASQAEQPG
jgi:DnaK suppressor protein